MQAFAVAALVTVLWFIVGYSLAFTNGGDLNAVIGGLSRAFGAGLQGSVHELAKTVPENVFLMYQATFAIITPAIIAGAFAERMKFSAMMWFLALLVLSSRPVAPGVGRRFLLPQACSISRAAWSSISRRHRRPGLCLYRQAPELRVDYMARITVLTLIARRCWGRRFASMPALRCFGRSAGSAMLTPTSRRLAAWSGVGRIGKPRQAFVWDLSGAVVASAPSRPRGIRQPWLRW